MSHTMNGKPMWCRPAPTRCGETWSPEDQTEKVVALAEMPRLVAAAIAAGLIRLPSDELQPFGWREGHIQRTCKKCKERFWIAPNKVTRRCIPCRIPQKPCGYCGKPFQPEQKKYKTCSPECAMAARKLYQDARSADYKAQRPQVLCPICGVNFGMKFSAGKMAKTCGKECGTVYFMRNAEEKRRQREANKQAKTK